MDKDLLSNRVVKEIIALISSGAYREGQRLPAERSLCAQLGVSRGTLRKALGSMEELGLVEIRHNSGIYVKSLSQAKLSGSNKFLPPEFENVRLEDVLAARKAIEVPAIELACVHVTARQLREIAGLLARMEAAVHGDLVEFLRYDMMFHQALVRASGNAVLVKAFEAIYEYHKFSTIFTSQQEGEEEIAFDFHRKLLGALKDRDARACRRILSQHLDDMQRYSQAASSRKKDSK